jgi:hypothetical protein
MCAGKKGEAIEWADERAPRLFGNDNSFGESRTPRHGGVFVQGKNVAIISNFKRTSGTREDGGLLSRIRGSLPKSARPTAS